MQIPAPLTNWETLCLCNHLMLAAPNLNEVEVFRALAHPFLHPLMIHWYCYSIAESRSEAWICCKILPFLLPLNYEESQYK
jgi:hypothetical protein